MPRKDSITTAVLGENFGFLKVIGYGKRDKFKRVPRVVRCVCGWVGEKPPGWLMTGDSKSCGCKTGQLIKQNRPPRKYPNGMPKGYSAWMGMKQRCENRDSPDYPRYGDRGIRVCARWKECFENFRDDMGPRPALHTLDRKDNEKHYSCGKCEECVASGWESNCRWATPELQANNRRNNRVYTLYGETMTLAQWAVRAGVKYGTVLARLRRGWEFENALTTPA